MNGYTFREVAHVATEILKQSTLGDCIFDTLPHRGQQFIFGKFDDELILTALEVLKEQEP